ncbi:MAG: hypothetical protein V7K89_02800 [Nostoc sp.]|uniref:hypothetical protein n=1 Tax=Nostoc sp. TaxID=1180 RepID=UPI002FFD0569
MFQLVGIGEQAGSGIPKIYRNWSQQHWRLPALLEEVEPDQTLLQCLWSTYCQRKLLENLTNDLVPNFENYQTINALL